MIIGFCGPIGSGKTTAARYLEAEHGFKRVRFAETLRNMLKAFGLTDEHLDGELKSKPCNLLGGKTPRYAMQSLGTGWGRDLIHPDLWLFAWENAARGFSRVVADDVRFPNEAAAIHARGGRVIKVERPGVVSSDTHVSEKQRIEPDDLLLNNDEMSALGRKLDALVGLNL